MIGILTALGPYGESAGLKNAQRLRAFVLLLRYSGLRIGDAVQLHANRLQNSKDAYFTSVAVAIRLMYRTDIQPSHPVSIAMLTVACSLVPIEPNN
jgi:integrase